MRLALLSLWMVSLGCINAQMLSLSGLNFPGPRRTSPFSASEKGPNAQASEKGSHVQAPTRRNAEIGGRPNQSQASQKGIRPSAPVHQRPISPAQTQAQQELKPFSPDFQRPEFKRPSVFGPESEESEEDFQPKRANEPKSVQADTTTVRQTAPPPTSRPPPKEVEAPRETELKRQQDKPQEQRQQALQRPSVRQTPRPQESFEVEDDEVEQPRPKPRPVQARRPAPSHSPQRKQLKRPVSDDEDEAADIQVPVVVKRPQQPAVKPAYRKQRPEDYEGEQKRRPIPQQDIEQSDEEEEEESVPDRLTILLQESKFSCADKKDGYYADDGLNCEVFHYCMDKVRHSWLCPQGASFHQVHLICMPASNDNVCKRSADYHFVNDYLYKPTSDDNSTYGDRYYPEDYEPGHPMNLDTVAAPKQQQRYTSHQPQRKIQQQPRRPQQQFNAQDAFFNEDFNNFRGSDRDNPFDRPQRADERPQRQADERPLRPEGQLPQRGPGPNQPRPGLRAPPPQKSDDFVPVYRPQPSERRSDKVPEKRPAQPAEEEEELESEEEE